MNIIYRGDRSYRLAPLSTILVLIFIFHACDSVEPRRDGREPEDGGVPIEGRVLFHIAEGYERYGEVCDPEIILSMETKRVYPCCNYSIMARTCFDGEAFGVDLLGIYMPDICVTAIGPALFRRPAHLPDGTFDFVISSADTVDRYEVTVTDVSITIETIDARFTEPRSNLIWRYPENSFACVCGTTDETMWICSDFRDSLLAMPDISPFAFPDSGTVPYPAGCAGTQQSDPAHYYLYENESDYDEAGEMLRRYSLETISQHDGVIIYLVNYRNKYFRSWLYTKVR